VHQYNILRCAVSRELLDRVLVISGGINRHPPDFAQDSARVLVEESTAKVRNVIARNGTTFHCNIERIDFVVEVKTVERILTIVGRWFVPGLTG